MTVAAGGGGSSSSGALLLPGWCLLACGGGGMHVSGFHASNLYGARKKEASSMLSAAFGERPRASLSPLAPLHRRSSYRRAPPQVVVRSSFLCSSSPRNLAARASPQSWRFTRPLVPSSPSTPSSQPPGSAMAPTPTRSFPTRGRSSPLPSGGTALPGVHDARASTSRAHRRRTSRRSARTS